MKLIALLLAVLVAGWLASDRMAAKQGHASSDTQAAHSRSSPSSASSAPPGQVPLGADASTKARADALHQALQDGVDLAKKRSQNADGAN